MEKSDLSRKKEDFKSLDVPLMRNELIEAQKSDSSLAQLFETIEPEKDIQNSSQGYFLKKRDKNI